MKRAIFFGIRKRLLSAILSGLLFTAGVVTPLGGILRPSLAIADDTPATSATPKNRVLEVVITAYSSSLDETDETPHLTAAGTRTRDGVIANNCLPFGTEVKIPEIFGDKTFVVEDRKNSRYGCNWIDLWQPSKEEAKKFGIAREVTVLVFE